MRQKGVHYSPATEFKKGVHYSPATEFKKGDIPHNKGKRISEYMSEESRLKCLKTAFKTGMLPQSALPKGTIVAHAHPDKKGRIHYDWTINIDWQGNRKPNNNYRRYLWEVEHQQDAPKGAIFASISGNDSVKPTIEDTELIDRTTLMKRNQRPKNFSL